MKTDIFVLILINFAHLGACVVKIWRYDNDIYNPEHWVGGKAGQQCDGLDLRNAKQSLLVIDKLDTKQILFPSTDAKIYFPEGTRINLHQNATMDCVQIKNNFASHSWMDPASWITKGAENNPAVPHMERVPCHYDDVIFPKGWKSSECTIDNLPSDVVRLRSFDFGGTLVADEDLRVMAWSNTQLFSGILKTVVSVEGITCYDKTGCLCGDYPRTSTCTYVGKPEGYPCQNPIRPIGFCTKICGASIVIANITLPDFTTKFDIYKVKEALEGYSSATHISKVHKGLDAVVQIVFAEKEFSGVSLDDAKDFYSTLLADFLGTRLDNSFGVTNAVLRSSGLLINEGKAGRTAVSIIFGSLLGVLLVFGVIFLVNSPRCARLNLTRRYHITSRPLSALLAKYDKMDEEVLTFQRSESTASLEKSFDNPMYGTSAPSTSSSSTIASSEEKASKSEIALENPMYDIRGLSEVELHETPFEGNQLVDLTPSQKASEE